MVDQLEEIDQIEEQVYCIGIIVVIKLPRWQEQLIARNFTLYIKQEVTQIKKLIVALSSNFLKKSDWIKIEKNICGDFNNENYSVNDIKLENFDKFGSLVRGRFETHVLKIKDVTKHSH